MGCGACGDREETVGIWFGIAVHVGWWVGCVAVGDGQGDADDRDTVCTAAHAVMGLFGCSICWISRCEVHSLFVSKSTALISDFAAFSELWMFVIGLSPIVL